MVFSVESCVCRVKSSGHTPQTVQIVVLLELNLPVFPFLLFRARLSCSSLHGLLEDACLGGHCMRI